MLKKKFNEQVLKMSNSINPVALYQEEMDYAKKMFSDLKIEQDTTYTRFHDAYIERVNKESDELIAIESAKTFLTNPIHYFKNHKNEFMYLESEWFQVISVDSVSLEVDDVFGTYDVMLGLKLPKKLEKQIKNYFTHTLAVNDEFDLMFNGQDGLWDLNFGLNFVPGYQDDMTIGEAYQLIYLYLFGLLRSIEEGDNQ